MPSNNILKQFLHKHFFGIIICVIFIIILLCFVRHNIKTINENFDTNNFEIVLAHYNEDIGWINKAPYNQFKVICYNKGENKDLKIDNLKSMVYLPNTGRESHTYLYHIINNYDNLANVTIFLMASMSNDAYNKKQKLKLLFDNLDDDNSIFICQKYNNVKEDLYKFSIKEYTSSSETNKHLDNALDLSQIRPFGKWFEHFFKDIEIKHVSYNSIFALNKTHILQHPKEYYEKLIAQVENSSSPETGHYFERSWEAVFYPLNNNTKFIEIKTV